MELSGGLFDYVIAFWSGVLVSFTPCVYPVMPITAGFIGGMNADGKRLMGLILSLLYVLGMALTYCILAVVASLTGSLFGQWQSSVLVNVIIAVFMICFAFMMFDWIQIPSLGVSFHGKIKKKNIWTLILFGMATGLAVGSCTAPVLGALLVYVASKQNIMHGISLIFVFSYGVGASLILVGTFSGLLSSLPKSGAWLARVKQLCGVLLFGVGCFYLFKVGQFLLNGY